MSGMLESAERLHLTTTPQWHDWLQANHRRPSGVWLVSWKPRSGKPAIPYEEAVCEALCYGWIDGTYRSLDEERGMLWWSPRRKGSVWARSNRERIARLEAEGRITEAGRAVVTAAKADGSWSVLIPVEEQIVPPDLSIAFAGRPGAAEQWESMTATARRAYLLWIVTARREETRRRRVDETAERVAAGLRYEDR